MGASGGSRGGGSWDLTSVDPPWTGAPSIHAHISQHIAPGVTGLSEGGDRLPDETDDGAMKWVAGGLDGAFGHHVGGGSDRDRARMLYRAIGVVLEEVTAVKLAALYHQLLGGGVLGIIDPLLELVVEKQELDPERLEALALWLATRAPDREPVKFAIAILGVISGSDHTVLLSTLGRHEELTLYAAVALARHDDPDGERKLFDLAHHVDGWGRIHIVERLSHTSDPAIQAWMLRDGYKNCIMYEYLAYTCAVSGGLRRELERDAVDATLLAGAGDIIAALITGGPAQDMDDYPDGAVVVERFLHHIGAEPTDLAHLLTVDSIQRFLDEESGWEAREERGWTPAVRTSLRARVLAAKALPHWRAIIDAGLAAEDRVAFSQAQAAAGALGIDIWDRQFDRLVSGVDDGWYFVMQTGDPARIDRVLSLAEERIPLGEIATGPGTETGLGRAWAHHRDLDFVLQELSRFPGKGWPLIRAGVRSPVIRNRHMALRALSAWGKGSWPSDAEGLLEATRAEEPDDGVRAEFETLLAGKEI